MLETESVPRASGLGRLRRPRRGRQTGRCAAMAEVAGAKFREDGPSGAAARTGGNHGRMQGSGYAGDECAKRGAQATKSKQMGSPTPRLALGGITGECREAATPGTIAPSGALSLQNPN